ncbi:MAG TPA: NAD-dependent epimerase/dehydratase family protein [Blastocatellia bacterium]|jgi:nucleoside-diphosphate-sugar epimerase
MGDRGWGIEETIPYLPFSIPYMKVLVIGGTGYIGSHTVEELARRGHLVSIFARGLTPAPQSVEVIKGDRHNTEGFARLRSLAFDAVIDINAYTREETQSAINVFDGAISRFVHLSTLAVYDLNSTMPLVEDSPLTTDMSAQYPYNKAECERALRWAYTKSKFPYVSIRPPGVFGPRDHISRENYCLKRMVAGDPIIVADSGATPIFAIYVKDLARCLVDAVEAEGVEGAAFHIMQREILSINQHIRSIAEAAGVKADVCHIPARLLERLGFNPYQFPYYLEGKIILADTTAARQQLGFAPTPYLRALKETVDYLLERGPESERSIEDALPSVIPRSRERLLVERYRRYSVEMEDRITDEWLSEAMPEM